MSDAHPAGFHPLRALLFLCGAQMLFSLLDATGKTLAEDMGIPLIALVRHAGQIVFMVMLLGPYMGRSLIATRHPWLQFWRGVALGCFTLFFFSALDRLPQAEATALNFIAPFVVMLLAGRLLGERVTRARWAGALLGFAGMLVLVRPGSALDPIGVVFVLLTVCCNVAFQLLTRRLATVDDSFATMFLSAAMGVVLSVAALPLQSTWGGWPESLDGRQVLMLLSLGVFGAISQWCLIRAYVWSSASFLAPLLYLQLLWSTAAGWLFFSQLPDRISLCGILLILIGGVATMLLEARGARRK